MISDDALYRLAIFLGSLAMLLIVLYHFLEINSKDDGAGEKGAGEIGGRKAAGEKGVGEKGAGEKTVVEGAGRGR